MIGKFSPEDNESWHTYHIETSETSTEAIVYAVSAVSNVPVKELDPLYDHMDPSALDELLVHANNHDSDFVFEFTWNGCEVIVADHRVHVRR